jgi:hypothetical protein
MTIKQDFPDINQPKAGYTVMEAIQSLHEVLHNQDDVMSLLNEKLSPLVIPAPTAADSDNKMASGGENVLSGSNIRAGIDEARARINRNNARLQELIKSLDL